MTPASYSNSDLSRISPNSAVPALTLDSSLSSTQSTHLHPMTNMDQDRDYNGWDGQNYPYGVKPWTTTEGESTSYHYSYNKNAAAGHPDMCGEAMNVIDPSLSDDSRPLFPASLSGYDLQNGLNGMSGLPSPTQSREEAQWQMYLSSSLSNPLDSLAFSIQTLPSLSYPPDVGPDDALSEEHISSVQRFAHPNDAMFGTMITTSSEHPNYQGPFADSPPELSVDFPASRSRLGYDQSDVIIPFQGPDHTIAQHPQETLTNGEYSSFIDSLSSGFVLPSTQIHLSSNLSLIPAAKSTPLHDHYPLLSHPSPVRPRRGLCGWSGPVSPEQRTGQPFATRTYRKRMRSSSPSLAITHRRLNYSNSKTASSANGARIPFLRDVQRSRNSESKPFSLNEAREFNLDSDGDIDDDADSDDYSPSRSPSPDPTFPSSYPVQFLCETGTESSEPSKKNVKRGKGKAKGSAALALAVVTQRGGTTSQDGSEQFDDDPLTVYHEGRNGIRKRKNHPIPLPVPIPNLNKKSRGRKVPFVAALTSSGGSTSSSGNYLDDGENGAVLSSGRNRKKTSRMPTPVQDELAGSRSYVCVVPGCGKCFVRGEHLKRHVRSIHTHDKPHPCPYIGCDKSFSRRDNLGQHVRIHLQP